ncbi:hypothetical protein Bca4012_065948 [Brassica carinata]
MPSSSEIPPPSIPFSTMRPPPSMKNSAMDSANLVKIGTERTRTRRGRACLHRIRMVVETSINLLKLPPRTQLPLLMSRPPP